MKKKIISLITAAATALTIGTAAQAAETDPQETVIIAGHECWCEDGYYFTNVDGEKCQVINLDDCGQVVENEQNDIVTYGSINGVYYDADLSSGQTFCEIINITNGDDETSTFFIGGDKGLVSAELTTEYVISATYNITIWYNFGISKNDWQEEPPQTLKYNLAIQTHKFFIGTGRRDDCIFKIVFHKEGSSTTQKEFKYWIKKGTM